MAEMIRNFNYPAKIICPKVYALKILSALSACLCDTLWLIDLFLPPGNTKGSTKDHKGL